MYKFTSHQFFFVKSRLHWKQHSDQNTQCLIHKKCKTSSSEKGTVQQEVIFQSIEVLPTQSWWSCTCATWRYAGSDAHNWRVSPWRRHTITSQTLATTMQTTRMLSAHINRLYCAPKSQTGPIRPQNEVRSRIRFALYLKCYHLKAPANELTGNNEAIRTIWADEMNGTGNIYEQNRSHE